VGEEQAIGYFTDGCREGTLMKHKLHRAEPRTMAEFMAIADKYASADSVARVQYPESIPATVNPSRHPARADITTVIAMARGRTSDTTTSMALSKWSLSKEARGLQAEARSARETSSTRTSTPSR
jgi:predicted ATPase